MTGRNILKRDAKLAHLLAFATNASQAGHDLPELYNSSPRIQLDQTGLDHDETLKVAIYGGDSSTSMLKTLHMDPPNMMMLGALDALSFIDSEVGRLQNKIETK